MYKVYCSTGCVLGRANDRDYRLLRDILPKIQCDGFELMFYSVWYDRVPEFVGFIRSLGVPFPTFHCDKFIGELLAEENFAEAFRRFEINCQTAQDVGSKIMVMHLWNGIISDSNIQANFSAYPTLKSIAEKYGITLTVENVLSHNLSPLTLWHKLLETSPDAEFIYDTKMAEFDRENDVCFNEEHIGFWQKIRHMHINDRTGGYRDWSSIKTLHIGEGTVDFDNIFTGLKKVGYAGDFTVEANSINPDGTIRFDDLNRSIAAVKKLAERLK